MNKLCTQAHSGLLAVTLAIVLSALTAACDTAQAKSPGSVQSPQAPRYFGDEFAHAQQALKDQPEAQTPQAF